MKERQCIKRVSPVCKCMGPCTLERSVQGEGVDAGGAKLVIKIDQSEMTKSHMFSAGMSLRLTNHK